MLPTIFDGIDVETFIHNGEQCFTAERLADWLEAKDARYVSMLYRRNRDLFDDDDTFVIEVVEGGLRRQVRLFTLLGAITLANKSDLPKGKQVTRWLKGLAKRELATNRVTSDAVSALYHLARNKLTRIGDDITAFDLAVQAGYTPDQITGEAWDILTIELGKLPLPIKVATHTTTGHRFLKAMNRHQYLHSIGQAVEEDEVDE